MACETPCKNCTRKGLPILFTRYAAAFSVQDKGKQALRGITPNGQFQAKPNDVTVQTATYNVRMLRPGYLYLYIERETEKTWEAYAVHPHGYLHPFLIESPDTAAAKAACQRDARQANNSLVWVEDAEHVVKLWYMFSPDPLDYQHLRNEIEGNLGKYMQSFDVASWVKGSQGQKDTCTPSLLDMRVVEYAALKNETLRDAIEPQLYGLMGANPQERAWGDYEEEVLIETMDELGGVHKYPTTFYRKQPSYEKVHGTRLQGMHKFLEDNKGAVVACEDPIGIAQELGYLQSEAQNYYAHWQVSQAKGGFSPGVTNEWVLQTGLNADSLRELVRKSAVARTNARIEQDNKEREFRAERYRIFRSHHPAEVRAEAEREIEEVRIKMQADHAAQMEAAKKKGEDEFEAHFDQAEADRFAKEVHKPEYEKAQTLRAQLGKDHCAWLRSEAFKTAMQRYSDKADRINRCGGGANLSLQLGQCFAGTESNTEGLSWLAGQDPWGDNPLSRMLCFNHPPYLSTIQQAIDAQEQTAPPPKADAPEAETDLWRLGVVSTVLRAVSSHASLGDKALGFMEAFPAIGASGTLRKLAWPGHVMSLMSVKLMQAIQAAPVRGREMQLVRFAALSGVSTLGRTVEAEAMRLNAHAVDIQRMQTRARKIEALSTPQRGRTGAAAMGRVNQAVPGTRAAMLGGLFDFGAALLKAGQMASNPSAVNARGATEMVGSIFQAIGSIADFRAKAYEETIFKLIRGADVYKKPALQTGLDALNTAALRGLQKTAFRWLLPAALIATWFDCADAWLSFKRGQNPIGYLQIVSAVGTVSGILGAGAVAFSWTAFGLTSAALGALLGLIGIVLVVGAMVLIAWLKEEDWVNWLIDCPLNKKKNPPNHDDLQETMQKYANAIADLGGAD